MRRIPAGLVTAMALALVPLGAAHAGEYVDTDQRGDVHEFSEADDLVPAPAVVNGDVVRSRVAHTSRSVALRVKFRELTRSGQFRFDFIRLVTNEGVRRDVHVQAGGQSSWQGKHEMSKSTGEPVRCRALSHFIDYDTNVVFIRVPRRCLQNPRWVKVGMGAVWVRSQHLYVDDAFLDGSVDERNPVLSPRVWRG